MAQCPKPILPLPADVAVQIKSSTSITSLSDVVFGLVKNSLDAGATKIEVVVDSQRGSCMVEDDGHGISPVEFQDHGGLGKSHCKARQSKPSSL